MKNLITKSLTVLCGLSALAALPVAGSAQTPSTASFTFSTTKPRLVVLLHGVTPKMEEDPEQKIGFSGHARHYWGFDFITGLQGRPGVSTMTVVTPVLGGNFRAYNTTTSGWHPGTPDSNGLDLAPICFPISSTNLIPSTGLTSQSAVRSYISNMTSGGQGANNTMVMINTRDGSKHLMPQLAETLEEIYYSYNQAFGSLPAAQQPQIYLVGHSFGGIIARAILANPTGPDLFGNRLSASQRLKADYLRKRVVLVQTLAAPHEGTGIGDPASDFADFFSTFGHNVLLGVLSGYNYFSSGNLTAGEVEAQTKDLVKTALDAISGKRDCLADLARVPEYNAGILHPETALRSANGSMVPIYTAAGRTPGGTSYDQNRSIFLLGGNQWNPISTFDLIRSGPRAAKEATKLNLVNSVLYHEGYLRQGKKPWGNATNPNGDRVSSPFRGIGPNSARPVSQGWFPSNNTIYGVLDSFLEGKPFVEGIPDGEWDSDGFLAWDSAHALNLNSRNFYRIYDPAKYGTLLPWDVNHHGDIMFNAANGVWIHNELIRNAGPIVKSGARTSVWGPFDNPATPANNIKVEVLLVNDPLETLDYGSGADYRITVRIGSQETTRNLPNNNDEVRNLTPFTVSNFAGTVVPIRITISERDNPPLDPDDLCMVSPNKGQSSMYLYFDTRTNRVLGDRIGAAGEILNTIPNWYGIYNPVQTKIRITKI